MIKTSVLIRIYMDWNGKKEKEINMAVPAECPMCGEARTWVIVEQSNKGFSVGKAVIGALLFGPVGVIGGALGSPKVACSCGRCGFQHEYDQ